MSAGNYKGKRMAKQLNPIPNKPDYNGTYKVQLTRHLEAKRTKTSLKTRDFVEARQICREIDSLRDNPEKTDGISTRAKAIFFGDVYESFHPTTASANKADGGIIEKRIESNRYIHMQNVTIEELRNKLKIALAELELIKDSKVFDKYKAGVDAPTLGDALEFNEHYIKTRLAKGSVATTHYPVAKILYSIEGVDNLTKITDIDENEIQEAVELDAQKSIRSVNNRYGKMRGLVQGFFKRCKKKFKTPIIALDAKPLDEMDKPWLRPDDFNALMNYHLDPTKKTMVAVFLLTGFRSKGVQHLTCGDVFIDNYKNEGFDHPVIRLNPKFSYKTVKSKRTIKINSYLLPLLAAEVKDKSPDDPLFPSHWDGKYFFYTESQMRRVTRDLFKGSPTSVKVNCLVCRTTFAQTQLKFGAIKKGLNDAQALLGHNDMSTTTIYTGSESDKIDTELNFKIGLRPEKGTLETR